MTEATTPRDRPLVATTVRAPHGLVCSVDHLASSAGVAILRGGGSAVDAAVAASAVLAVTTQHMCGMGGDLFALVHGPGMDAPVALASVGRAGSRADPEAMRHEGLARMPHRLDVRSATVPGCVDGWIALHERFGRLPLPEVLEPARSYAAEGFPISPLGAAACWLIAEVPGADDYLRTGSIPAAGDVVRRPAVAEILTEVAGGGRDAFFQGRFGDGLLELGGGLFTEDDLARPLAEWCEPLRVGAWGHELWTVPPPSQGYLSLAGAWIASGLPLPDDPEDPGWPHLLSEAARAAGRDRLEVLFDGADGGSLLAEERLEAQRAAVDPLARGVVSPASRDGGTIYLCVVDRDRMGVSLIQSNAADWGCHVVVPGTGIFLHNRGIGFSLVSGHPAELGPRRRPPHTLSPALVTEGPSLRAVLGTMGGDIQPQVVLQMLTRLLLHRQSPGRIVGAPRWAIGGGGFDIWADDGPQTTEIERPASPAWANGLRTLGHEVVERPAGTGFGHAHLIEVAGDVLAGAADPRAVTGAASGY